VLAALEQRAGPASVRVFGADAGERDEERVAAAWAELSCADVLVGAGAALASLPFARPGAVLLEMQAAAGPAATLAWRLAAVLQLTHYWLRVGGAGGGPLLPRLEAALDGALARPRPRPHAPALALPTRLQPLAPRVHHWSSEMLFRSVFRRLPCAAADGSACLQPYLSYLGQSSPARTLVWAAGAMERPHSLFEKIGAVVLALHEAMREGWALQVEDDELARLLAPAEVPWQPRAPLTAPSPACMWAPGAAIPACAVLWRREEPVAALASWMGSRQAAGPLYYGFHALFRLQPRNRALVDYIALGARPVLLLLHQADYSLGVSGRHLQPAMRAELLRALSLLQGEEADPAAVTVYVGECGERCAALQAELRRLDARLSPIALPPPVPRRTDVAAAALAHALLLAATHHLVAAPEPTAASFAGLYSFARAIGRLRAEG
jgi:hypothetical protein